MAVHSRDPIPANLPVGGTQVWSAQLPVLILLSRMYADVLIHLPAETNMKYYFGTSRSKRPFHLAWKSQSVDICAPI